MIIPIISSDQHSHTEMRECAQKTSVRPINSRDERKNGEMEWLMEYKGHIAKASPKVKIS